MGELRGVCSSQAALESTSFVITKQAALSDLFVATLVLTH